MGVPYSHISPEEQEKNKQFIAGLNLGLQELFANGECIRCGGDDVECLNDCTEHKCIDCGYVPEQDYSTLDIDIDSTGG